MWLTTASWTWSATALSGCTVSWGHRACTRVRSLNVPLTSSPLPGTRWSRTLSCWRWWSRSSTSFLCCRWALAGCEMGLCPVSDQHMTSRNKYYEGHYLHLEMYLHLCLILFSEPVWVMHKEILSLASLTWLRPHFSLIWHKNWDYNHLSLWKHWNVVSLPLPFHSFEHTFDNSRNGSCIPYQAQTKQNIQGEFVEQNPKIIGPWAVQVVEWVTRSSGHGTIKCVIKNVHETV